jgi:hypothetical protein
MLRLSSGNSCQDIRSQYLSAIRVALGITSEVFRFVPLYLPRTNVYNEIHCYNYKLVRSDRVDDGKQKGHVEHVLAVSEYFVIVVYRKLLLRFAFPGIKLTAATKVTVYCA